MEKVDINTLYDLIAADCVGGELDLDKTLIEGNNMFLTAWDGKKYKITFAIEEIKK